ncbi:MAG TPA: hypothetical protein VGB79_14110 [Allosphingosinicella sp.]
MSDMHILLDSARSYARSDPPASIWKAGLAAEAIAAGVGAAGGRAKRPEQSHELYLEELERAGLIAFADARQFHGLRVLRNRAVHGHEGTAADAQRALRLADGLAGLTAARGAGRAAAGFGAKRSPGRASADRRTGAGGGGTSYVAWLLVLSALALLGLFLLDPGRFLAALQDLV